MSGKKTPAWKNAQQKTTGAQNNDDRANKPKDPTELVKILMKTDYREVVKAGQVWETDAEKAAELVKLNRAEYVEESKASRKKASDEDEDDEQSDE